MYITFCSVRNVLSPLKNACSYWGVTYEFYFELLVSVLAVVLRLILSYMFELFTSIYTTNCMTLKWRFKGTYKIFKRKDKKYTKIQDRNCR
jgi:hypothetical protein